MKVYIIWGFLGSGKTTLINYLLSTVLKDRKVVIVENESGKESVDGVFLRSKNYQVKDLRSGCICCTLRLELPRVMTEIEHAVCPDIVLIEPSGLASLEELIRIQDFTVDGILTLIDVGMYAMLMKLNAAFYRRQFLLSPVIVLTKTGQTDAAGLNTICNELRSVAPSVRIIQDYHQLKTDEWEQLWSDCRVFNTDNSITYLKTHNAKFGMQTLPVNSPLDLYFYENLLNRFNKQMGILLLRGKGILEDVNHHWHKIDFVQEKVTVEDVPDYSAPEKESFISVWWDQAANRSPLEWITPFVNATEVACPVDGLNVDDNELFRYLGFETSGPDRYQLDFIRRLKSEALSICKPRFGYRFLSGLQVDSRALIAGGQEFKPGSIIVKCLRKADFYATIVASVGEEFDEWLNDKHSGGDLLETFIADALGSVIVEAIIAWGISLLTDRAKTWEMKVSNSYSPGYCGWDVAEQQHLFSMLPVKFCGVTLTGSSLMLPVKSISALVGIGSEIEKKAYGCAICRKKDCFKRKEVVSL